MSQLIYGGVPVPFTASWSAEEKISVGPCLWGGKVALVQPHAPGEGRPRFGKPHSIRQRQVIALGLCDLCAKDLKTKTKVSLSHARVRANGAEGPCVMQVEPLLCRGCAKISMAHCPSLKRDIADGSLIIRQVTRYRVQMAIMSSEYVETITGTRCKAVGHAKVELLAWIDRDADWLDRAA